MPLKVLGLQPWYMGAAMVVDKSLNSRLCQSDVCSILSYWSCSWPKDVPWSQQLRREGWLKRVQEAFKTNEDCEAVALRRQAFAASIELKLIEQLEGFMEIFVDVSCFILLQRLRHHLSLQYAKLSNQRGRFCCCPLPGLALHEIFVELEARIWHAAIEWSC